MRVRLLTNFMVQGNFFNAIIIELVKEYPVSIQPVCSSAFTYLNRFQMI
jgi:hypothetical protein